MGTVDPFGRTDQLDEDVLAALVNRFEARGRHPMFSQMLEGYLDAMQVEDATAVLDMGCGTGALVWRHGPSRVALASPGW